MGNKSTKQRKNSQNKTPELKKFDFAKPLSVDLNKRLSLPHMSPKLWSDLILPHLNLVTVLLLGATCRDFYTFVRKYLKKIEFAEFGYLLEDQSSEYHKELLKLVSLKYPNLKSLDCSGLCKQVSSKFSDIPEHLLEELFPANLEELHHVVLSDKGVKILSNKLPQLRAISMKYNSATPFCWELMSKGLTDLQLRLSGDNSSLLKVPKHIERLKVFKAGKLSVDLSEAFSLNSLTISTSSQEKLTFVYSKENVPKSLKTVNIICASIVHKYEEINDCQVHYLEDLLKDLPNLDDLKLQKTSIQKPLTCSSVSKLVLKGVQVQMSDTYRLSSLLSLKRLKISRMEKIDKWCASLPPTLKRLTISRCSFSANEIGRGDVWFLCKLPKKLERIDVYYAQQTMKERLDLNDQILRQLPESLKSFRIFERFYVTNGHSMSLLKSLPLKCKSVVITHLILGSIEELDEFLEKDVALGTLTIPVDLLESAHGVLRDKIPSLDSLCITNVSNIHEKYFRVKNWSMFSDFFKTMCRKCRTLEFKGFIIDVNFLRAINDVYISVEYFLMSQMMFKFCFFELGSQEIEATVPRSVIRLKILRGRGSINASVLYQISRFLEEITIEGKFGFQAVEINQFKKKLRKQKITLLIM